MTVAAIRVDADREKGLGHLTRCFALAHELAQQNHSPVFITRDKAFVRARAAEHGFPDVDTFSEEGSEAEAILARGPGLVIFDIGSTAHDQIAPIKEVGCFVVTFEDLGDGRYLSDIVVDANLTDKTNPQKIETSTRYLLGADYAIISKECQAAKKRRLGFAQRFRKGNLRQIIVSCGGSDPGGLTPRIASALSRFDTEIDIELILGPAFVPVDELNKAILSSTRVFSISESPSDLPMRMRRADLGIICGGVTLFEAAYLGLPAIVIAQNPIQLRNLPPFEASGGIVSLGLAAHDPFANIPSTIKTLCDKGRLAAMSAAQQSQVDGRGLDRVMAAIRELLGR